MLGAVAIVIFFGINAFVREMNNDSTIVRKINVKKMNLVLAPITLAFLFSFVFYEFPGVGSNSTVVTFENDRVITHPNGLFIWEGSSNFANLDMGWKSFGSGVSVVTENPKVRRIHYELFARVKYPADFYIKEYRRSFSRENEADDELRKLVDYQIYDFNNIHSKELAQFYNPLDEEQNKQLKELLESYFNERLAEDGVEVVFQKFSVE